MIPCELEPWYKFQTGEIESFKECVDEVSRRFQESINGEPNEETI